MKNIIIRTVLAFCFIFVPALVLGAAPITKDIRIVVATESAIGDVYDSSVIMAKALEKKLAVKVTVDVVGIEQALKAVEQEGANGSTLMISNDAAYLGALYGVKGRKNLFKNFTLGPTIASNPGNAYLASRHSQYWSIFEVISACQSDMPVRVAVESGGPSAVGYTALKHAIKIMSPGKEKNLIAVPANSQAARNKVLFDGQADIISGSVQTNEKFAKLPVYERTGMRIIWSPTKMATMRWANADGFGKIAQKDIIRFLEPYVWIPYTKSTNFTFDKGLFFVYNKNISPQLVRYFDKVLGEIFAVGGVRPKLIESYLVPDFKPSWMTEELLLEKSKYVKEMLSNLKS